MSNMTKVVATSILGMLFGIAACSANAADQKPQTTQGLEGMQTAVQQFPLAAQIPAMAGYELRSRRIVIAPGGAITEHSHAQRPGIVYIVEGSMEEHRGDVTRIVKPGDSWVEDANTVHWFANPNDKPCVIWSVDLVSSKK